MEEEVIVETVEKTLSLVKAVGIAAIALVVGSGGGFVIGKVVTKKKISKLQETVENDLKK